MYSFNINVQISDIELKSILSDLSNSINIPPIKILSPTISSTDLNSDALLYTVPEVAEILKVDQHKVYELIDRKILVALKLGRLKITRSELFRFLNDYNGKDLSDLKHIKDL